jgi:hypothetical protein
LIDLNGHIDSTKKPHKSDVPLYFSDEIIPAGQKHKNVVFNNSKIRIDFTQIENSLMSIPYAPWGSFLVLDKYDEKDFEKLIQEINQYGRSESVEKIVIKHPPPIYTHSIPLQRLRKIDITSRREINQHINLINRPSLHTMEKRKLSKCKRRFTFSRWNHPGDVHDLIKKWRTEKGIPLNIDKKHLFNLFQKKPSHYDCWAVLDNQEPIALCVCIQVTSDVVYYFLPATAPSHQKSSPMVFLINEICNYYSMHGFSILDLGQSSINGNVQQGLFEFKKRMGAETSYKPTFEWSI